MKQKLRENINDRIGKRHEVRKRLGQAEAIAH